MTTKRRKKIMADLTWKEIEAASAEAGFFHGVMGAYENAASTIHEEKSADESEFDNLCLATLSEYLAYGNLDKAEHDFFVSIGIQF
jgi:DUF438 domain-containing protein